MLLERKAYLRARRKNVLHKRLKKGYALEITPRDIMYLILPYEEGEGNVLRLHDYIIKLYERKYGRKEAVLVTTTIMTDDCIFEDV